MAAMTYGCARGRARICQEVLYAKKERALGIQEASTDPVRRHPHHPADRSGPLTWSHRRAARSCLRVGI